MDRNTEKWIKLMDWFSKYWGCHQLPERSFFFGKYQFPICARCTGIILGYLFSITYSVSHKKIKLIWTVILLLPMAIDGGLQFLTHYLSNNIKRFITGILAGFGFIQFVKSFFLLIFETKIPSVDNQHRV
jgi:uncharacterized membrane protein